jgi:site-specific DNA recombinase
MIAAIYARKSTDQTGVADDQKSVARQVERATAYAAAKGWRTDDACVFVDDGISGAEFANRPGFLRLMNALKPRPPFHVLIMSEESRLGRESIETAYALKQLVQAGVRVFFYLEDRERTLDSPIEKIMMQLTGFADELEREKARQRTYDAMARKAQHGHVTGGRVFGYDNVPVLVTGSDGQARRSHVERHVNELEAVVVRRIFELTAQGRGKTTIAKMLNAEGATAPRAQQGRPRSWSPSSVYEVMFRPLYRGEIVWNKTKKRDTWGKSQQRARPEGTWIRRDAPALRIVPEEVWSAAHRRLDDSRTKYLRGTDGRLWGRPSGNDSKYLLPGFARCAQCNGVMHVRSHDHGRRRAQFYACTSYHKRGRAICSNGLEVSMERIDAAVLGAIAKQVLQPDIVEEIIARAFAMAAATDPTDDLEQLHAELRTVDVAIANYVAAIGAGGDVPELLAALKARRTRRTDLARDIAARERQSERSKGGELLTEIERRINTWRELMTRHAAQSRQMLKKMLRGRPILFEATEEDGQRGYRFRGDASIMQLLSGLVGLPLTVASPAGFEPAFWP